MSFDLFEGPKLAGDAPKGLGSAMAGGDKARRRALDYYPTPPEATRALILAESPALAEVRRIWEPCGRGGAIARVAAEFGIATIATDVVADPDNDVAAADLFAVKAAPAPHVITNLPFALARPMVAHLWGVLQLDYMALLFKAQFLNSGESAALWRAGLAPTRRWDVTWRLDFTGGGAPTMDCAWLVWDRRDRCQAFGLLDRGGPVRAEGLV